MNRLENIKNNIIEKWDEYTHLDKGGDDNEFAANQLKWIFTPLCVSVHTQQIVCIKCVGMGQIELKFALQIITQIMTIIVVFN